MTEYRQKGPDAVNGPSKRKQAESEEIQKAHAILLLDKLVSATPSEKKSDNKISCTIHIYPHSLLCIIFSKRFLVMLAILPPLFSPVLILAGITPLFHQWRDRKDRGQQAQELFAGGLSEKQHPK